MAITYTVLTGAKTVLGSIANWAMRSDLPTSNILTEAEAFIYQKLRVREMMTMDEIAVLTANYKASLPSGFLDPIKLTPYGWGDPLPYLGEEKFVPLREEDGTRIEDASPSCWTVIGIEMWFDIKLTAAFGGDLLYYKQPTALSGANETNFMTTRYPTILRHSCESFAYEHMKDPARSLEFRTLAEAEIEDANMTNEMFRTGQYH